MNGIASYLRNLRQARKLSQAAAADLVGLDRRTIERWERGEEGGEPSLTRLVAYVEAIGGSTSEAIDLLLERATMPDEEPEITAARARVASLRPDALLALMPILDQLDRAARERGP